MNHQPGRPAVLDVEPAKSDFLSEAIAGLSSTPPTLPCKFFYDERGATLFQKICELPEYYVTRTELDILKRNSAEIALHLGPRIALIGLGTGPGTKTCILLEKLREPIAYIPVDISKDQLQNSTTLFHERFPQLIILRVKGGSPHGKIDPAQGATAGREKRRLGVARADRAQGRRPGQYYRA